MNILNFEELCFSCQEILKYKKNLNLCSNCQGVLNKIVSEQVINQILSGNLPVISQNRILLNSDEICHLETDATYLSPKKDIKGYFLASNKKFYFLSPDLKFECLWKNLLSVKSDGRFLNLELNRKTGSGRYLFPDLKWTEAILQTLLKQNRRILVNTKSTSEIPQHVKVAVWQRDMGKCVQCHDNQYLEYDHIIPRSKGGSDSEKNIQLLCRKCNEKKGSKI